MHTLECKKTTTHAHTGCFLTIAWWSMNSHDSLPRPDRMISLASCTKYPKREEKNIMNLSLVWDSLRKSAPWKLNFRSQSVNQSWKMKKFKSTCRWRLFISCSMFCPSLVLLDLLLWLGSVSLNSSAVVSCLLRANALFLVVLFCSIYRVCLHLFYLLCFPPLWKHLISFTCVLYPCIWLSCMYFVF